ncbi:MAG: HTH-type transcriptional regulator HdfR [Enterobacteriaceae bacterium]
MDIDLLKTFLEVSRTRHFSRAAESLYLTQSAISFRIRQLENQLGVILFTRQRNNIHLTSAGKNLLPFAEKLIATWQEACQKIVATEQMSISVGAQGFLWETLLIPWVEQACRLYPALQMESKMADRSTLLDQLHQREIDVLVTTEASKIDELQSVQIGELSLTKFSARKAVHHKKPPYIHVEWNNDFVLTDTASALLSTGSAQLARQLLKSSGGYTFLPVKWAKSYPDLKMDKSSARFTCSVYAVWYKNSTQNELIHTLFSQQSEGEELR